MLKVMLALEHNAWILYTVTALIKLKKLMLRMELLTAEVYTKAWSVLKWLKLLSKGGESADEIYVSHSLSAFTISYHNKNS